MTTADSLKGRAFKSPQSQLLRPRRTPFEKQQIHSSISRITPPVPAEGLLHRPEGRPVRTMMDQDTTQAFAKANRELLEELTSCTKRDPAFDLTEILVRQIKSYKETRRRAQAPVQTAGLHLQFSGKVRIVHPLQAPLIEYLDPAVRDRARHMAIQELTGQSLARLDSAIKNGQRLSSVGSTHVVCFATSYVVKIGPSIDLDHIKTLQFVKSQDPSLPAPDILGVLETNQRAYLFMSLAKGVPLEKIWSRLDGLQKSSIKAQLTTILQRLRQIPPPQPSPWLGGMSARCKDLRRMKRVADGPIKSEAEFNDFLCSKPRAIQAYWIKLVRSSMREDHKIVMTHGDLHPRNIMVMWNGLNGPNILSEPLNSQSQIRVTSLIDWELSGWYPEHWEFVKAINRVGPRDPMSDWSRYLPSLAIGTWMVEYAIDVLISRWLA